jgi:outer membrane lipoprotein-sorting protein
MKRFFTLILGCLVAATSLAQTAEEIVARMDEVMSQTQKQNAGVRMTMDMKMPLIGTISSTAYTLGEKMRVEMSKGGNKYIAWMDETTSWDYDLEKNEVVISKRKSQEKSEAEENAELFDGITEGYSVSIKKQTADAWYILCKKLKSNPEKDDPKTMDLVVSKATYMPLSLKATVSVVTITLSNLGYGVTEDQVTFNPADYPGVKIKDER